MSSVTHTYGPTCHLSRSVSFSGSKANNDIPDLKAQFFYNSPLPIDDPLSAVPTPAASDSKSIRHPPRPFSARDNNALEEAWLGFFSEKDRKHHSKGKYTMFSGKRSPSNRATGDDCLDGSQKKKLASVNKKESSHLVEPGVAKSLDTATDSPCKCRQSEVGQGYTGICDASLRAPNATGVIGTPDTFPKRTSDHVKASISQESTENEVNRSVSPTTKLEEQIPQSQDSLVPLSACLCHGDAFDDATDPNSTVSEDEIGSTTLPSYPGSLPSQGGDSGTTGMPFLKYSSPSNNLTPRSPNEAVHYENENQNRSHMDDDGSSELNPTEPAILDHSCKAYKNTKQSADVPVGLSRLHLVKLPALQMRPIYWSPVHDIAAVTRATWFYKDTMYPVETGVANQLEVGYRELRPWSQTWSDELNSALEVGAPGEEKISHRLWPRNDDSKGGLPDSPGKIVASGPYCAARCFRGEAAAEGSIDTSDSENPSGLNGISKIYPQSHVVYKDAQNAFILRPNLQPSAYHGRRPLQKIMKGITVGTHVVRGFDWRAWEKSHPSKKSKVAAKAAEFGKLVSLVPFPFRGISPSRAC